MKISHTTYEVLQILSITMLNKTQLNQLFQQHALQQSNEDDYNQLALF